MKRMGVLSKIGIIAGGAYLGVLLLIILLLVCLTGGGGTGGTGIPILATEEQVYEYQYVCAEIGVPWDVVLLTDIFFFDQNKEENPESNPVFTSLQFCVLTEKQLTRHMVKTDELTPEGEERWEAEWPVTDSSQYYGLSEILQYLDVDSSWLMNKDMTAVIKKINKICEEKAAERDKEVEEDDKGAVRYVAELSVNEDTERVLKDMIGLSEKNCETVMKLHEVQYMAKIYGIKYDFSEVALPELTMGEVTRMQLAQVAVSLIGHPYALGGKSPQRGAPQSPLDCSGYIDWVYIQCFGTGVSSGGVPEGVAVSGTALQWYASAPVSESNLKIGDLAFLNDPAKLKTGSINHVGIYIGEVDGVKYFVHCAGKSYGTKESPSGRVGISKRKGGSNQYNCVTDSVFEPEMKACNFRYFRRPRFTFIDDDEEE